MIPSQQGHSHTFVDNRKELMKNQTLGVLCSSTSELKLTSVGGTAEQRVGSYYTELL